MSNARDLAANGPDLESLVPQIPDLVAQTPEIVDRFATQGRKNLLINGGFDIWQRGTSVSLGATLYGSADRWRTNSSGATGTFSQLVLAADGSDVAGSRFGGRLDVTVGNDYTHIGQRLEVLRETAGKTLTFSFKYKLSGKALNIRASQLESNAGGGTVIPGSTQPEAALPLAPDWTEFSFTFTLDSLPSAYAYSATECLQLIIEQGGTDTSTTPYTLDIAQLQLEFGSIATPFEFRPIGEELALCQRYYQDVDLRNSIGAALDSAQVSYRADLPVTMRAASSGTAYGTPSYWQAATISGSWGSVTTAPSYVKCVANGFSTAPGYAEALWLNASGVGVELDAEL